MGYICKNDTLFMDLLSKSYDGDKNAIQMVQHSISAFLMEPKTISRKIQAESVSTDMGIVTRDAFNIHVNEDNFDLKWEAAFWQSPLGEAQDSWEIADVTNSLQFQLIEEGGRVQVDEYAGTLATIYVDYYGGALGWTDKMIRFRKISRMLQVAQMFRNNFWSTKALIHYTLLATAAAANVTAYQGAAAIGQVRRDILTINTAALAIANLNLNKSFGDMASAPLYIYANPSDEPRIEAAFLAKTGDQANAAAAGVSATQITKTRPITRFYTFTTAITALHPIMVLPKGKIQKADAMQPTTFKNPKNILTLNETQAVWAIYGAGIGDNEQCAQFDLV